MKLEQLLSRAAPWLIVGLAAAFRLGSLDLAAFTYDDADVVLRARAVAEGRLALAGAMSSWGIPDPPLLVYLAALLTPLPSPAFFTLVLMAVLNTLAVAGTYLLGARYYGRTLGLCAALLFAVNPWAIYFGRRGWSEVHPLLTLLALWGALGVVAAGQARYGFHFFLGLAAGVQARLVALAFAPAALASLLLGGRRWLSRWSLLGLLASVLLSLPYLVHLFLERERYLQAWAEGNRTVAEAPAHGVLEFSWWIAAGLNLLPTPVGLADWLDQLNGLMTVSGLVAGLLLAVGLAWCLLRSVRRASGWQRHALLLAWTVLPPALMAWQSSTVYLHYLVVLFPTIFLVMAIPVARLLEGARFQRAAAWAALLVVVPSQAVCWLALQRTLTIYQTAAEYEAPLAEREVLAELERESSQRLATGEQYGVEIPMRFWLAAAEVARQALERAPRELLVATDGTDPLSQKRPAIVEAIFEPDLRPRYLDAGGLVLPLDRPALLLVTSDVELPTSASRLGEERALVPLPTLGRGTRDGARFFDLPARDFRNWSDAAGLKGRAPSSGRTVVAFKVSAPVEAGDTLDLLTIWRGPAAELRPALVLSGPDGERFGQRETTGLPLALTADQILLSRHEVPIPERTRPGRYRLTLEPRPGVSEGAQVLGNLTVREP